MEGISLQTHDQSIPDRSRQDDLDQVKNPKYSQAEGRSELFNQRLS